MAIFIAQAGELLIMDSLISQARRSARADPEGSLTLKLYEQRIYNWFNFWPFYCGALADFAGSETLNTEYSSSFVGYSSANGRGGLKYFSLSDINTFSQSSDWISSESYNLPWIINSQD